MILGQPAELRSPEQIDSELDLLKEKIDKVNEFLLTGATCKIHEMSMEQLSAFLAAQEVFYKKCIEIKLSRSIKNYAVGLDFNLFKEAQKKKATKKIEQVQQGEVSTKTKKAKKPSIIAELGLDLAQMIAMKNPQDMFCDTHKKLRKDCGCPMPVRE